MKASQATTRARSKESNPLPRSNKEVGDAEHDDLPESKRKDDNTDDKDNDDGKEEVDPGPKNADMDGIKNGNDDEADMMGTTKWKSAKVESTWPGKSKTKQSKASKNVGKLKSLDASGTENLLGESEKRVCFDPFLVKVREHLKQFTSEDENEENKSKSCKVISPTEAINTPP